MFRSLNIDKLVGMQEYLQSIGETFCPFLLPAQKESLLLFSEYNLKSDATPQARIFYAGLLHTELLRKMRARQSSVREHNLLCENLVLQLPDALIPGKELFGWPHWLLKITYTKVGVLFGKFWIGERDTSKSGAEIPSTPYHFLSIRTAIKPVDNRFFSKAPQLTEEYVRSCDSGENVLSDMLGLQPPPCILEAGNLDPISATEETFHRMIEEMCESNFYEELCVVGKTKL
jgi:hypothetical protein